MTTASLSSAPSASQSAAPDVANNAGIAMFASVFYMATRLLLPPLALAHLSLAEYGLWSVCFILIMYIGLADVGFSNVYVRFVAQFHAAGDTAAINRLLSTGVLTLAAISLLLIAGLSLALPQVLDFLKVDSAQRGAAQVLVLGAVAMFLLDMTLGAYCYVLHGLQRIREEKRVAIVGFVLEPLLILLFFQLGLGVYSLLLAFVLRYLWSLLAFARLAHRFLPGLRLRPALYDRTMLKHFFGFGAAVQCSALLGTVLFSIDRVLAGFLLGPQGVALFELGSKLPVSAIAIPANISNVIYPAGARHAAQNAQAAIRALHAQASRATGLVASLPLAFMVLFAAPLSQAWLGERAELAALPSILALSALAAHLHIITGPGSALFRAMGQVANEFVYHGLRIATLALACGLLVLLDAVDVAGLAFALSGSGLLAALLYLLHNQRRLGLPLGALLRDILLPAALAYPLAALSLGLGESLVPATASRWQLLSMLLGCGLFYTLAWASCLWPLLRRDERAWISLRLSPLTARLPRWRKT